jgi:tripartite-type tricarboxylate transporter receptor subunit TctC
MYPHGAIATELGNGLDMPVVIENVGDAGESIGARHVARATADANNELAKYKLVTEKVKNDPMDFTHISLIASQPLMLVACSSSGCKTIPESHQYKNMGIGVWFAQMAPTNLSQSMSDELKKALNDSMQSPDLYKKLEANGSIFTSPNVNMGQYVVNEVAM